MTTLRGKVEIDFSRCGLGGDCAAACPTPALRLENDASARRATLRLDLGQCVFCGHCAEACPEGAIRLTGEIALAARRRGDLVAIGRFGGAPLPRQDAAQVAKRVRERSLGWLGRALQIRHIDVGSCGGCEDELRALAGPVPALASHGFAFVDSPHHADLLLVSGTPTAAMAGALRAAHAAMPAPALVVALGVCAIGGGVFAASPSDPGIAVLVPVDVFVPGCPPPPEAVLHGLLLALERAPQKVAASEVRASYPG